MPAWEKYDPNLSSSQRFERQVPKRDPATGEVIYQRDDKGQLIRNKKGDLVPETITQQPYSLNERQSARVEDNKRITQDVLRGNLQELDTLVDRISTGHSAKKHVQGQNTLRPDGTISVDAKTDLRGDRDGTYGTPLDIKDAKDFKNHLKATINDPETIGYTKKDGTIILFNQKTNTLLAINAQDPDGGTAYRADDGIKNFIRCLNNDAKSGNLNGSASEALKKGGLKEIVKPSTPEHTRSTASFTVEDRLNQMGTTIYVENGDKGNRKLKQPLMPHHVRAMGLVGGALAVAAGAANAAEAEGRSVRPGDYARSAWEQTLGDPLSKGRYAEAVMRVLEKGDPTPGLISSGLRGVFGAAGMDVDPGITDAIKKLPKGALSELKQNATRVAYMQRDQFFLLQSVGLTELRDENGQRKDVGKVLRDPDMRASFLQNLNRAHEYEPNPEQKQKLKQMIGACHDFQEVETQRQTLLNRTAQILDAPDTNSVRTAQAVTRPLPAEAKPIG